MKPTSAFETFESDPTPSNAVALAVADHRAGKLIDWPFVDALNKAKDQLDANHKLIEMLRRFSVVDEYANREIVAGNGGAARQLLMDYRKDVAALLREVA
jgi:hypothetical protein